MKKFTSSPSLRLAALSAAGRRKYIISAKGWAQGKKTTIGIYCRCVRRTIESVALVSLFTLGLGLLSLIMAMKDIWKNWLKGPFMARISRANRTDANQSTIADDLRTMGMSVQILSNVGDGCPDLLVGYGGRNYLIEVKTENGQLTHDQREFFDEWRGQCDVAKRAEDVLKVIKTQIRFGK